MDLFLKGKTALITGGIKGLGKAICESLAEEGVNIIINYRHNANNVIKAKEIANHLQNTYDVKAIAIAADITNEFEIKKMFNEAEEKLGEIDILVNNAGICPTSMVSEMPTGIFTKTIETNLIGTFFTCREMSQRLLLKQKKGKIINVASQAAFNGSATGKSHYAASKGGIVAFTVSLAKELAANGTCVNAIAPGMIKTEMVVDTLEKNAERYKKSIPLGRPAEAEEVAVTVTFLASQRADYITGSTLDVSGGVLMR